MDKLRSKKRGFFAISSALSSSSDKKRNKGSKQDGDQFKEIKPEFRFFNKEKTEESINVYGDYQEFDHETDDELEAGDISENSSSEVETAASGSSCDDVHKASRKLQTFAKKSIRRDKKKEKEKQERKEKNKLSMDDFLSKQVEFITWLEEEKSKNPKDMSSPKRKAYFKTFLKLWNKKKLPQKYYRGSAEIQSPCPTIPPRTFSFADDEEEVVSFKRPKSKRLSIEPWGPPDSPFSTFGKTPPKQLHTPNLALIESPTSVTDSSLTEELTSSLKHNSLPKLGEYQMPKNALPMSELDESTHNTEISNPETVVSDLPGTPAPSCPEKSPVYAVPWKPKPTPRKKPPVIAEAVTSPPPPPLPPKLFLNGEDNSTEQQAPHDHQDNEVFPAPEATNVETNCEPRTVGRLAVSERDCSSMEVDDCCADGQVFLQGEGWQRPLSGKPFSPPVKIRKTFFPQEQIYAEIDSLEMNPTASDSHHVRPAQEKTSTSSDVFTESGPESHSCDFNDNRNSASMMSSPESEVKHVVLENLQKTKENRFSFSKYLITPEKRAAAPGKQSSSLQNGKENVLSKKCVGQTSELLPEGGSNQKEKPVVMPRSIPRLQSEFRVTMTVSNGLHNVRNFVVGNKHSTEAKDSSLKKAEFEKAKTSWKKEQHPCTSESKLEMTEKFTMSLDKLGKPDERLLETDIDSIPLPVMGSKTPPRKRRPLSNLQRSKSMETIIW